jgi:predicted O-methyltransferase YrrM
MLERLTDPRAKTISTPSPEAVLLVTRLLAEKAEPIIAEVGVGIGATSVALCRLLENRGELHLFDFQDRLDALKHDLNGLGFTNVRCAGNSDKTYDSYAWTLAQLLSQRRHLDEPGLFDFVYLDGGHAFHLDAPAAVILKDLLLPGGTLLFDDLTWSFAKSPTNNPRVRPEIAKQYSAEQIETPHVKLVCELFFDRDARFERVPLDIEHRRAYRKLW